MSKNLMKSVTLQIHKHEYDELRAEADRTGECLAAVVRRRAGFEPKRKIGAPAGNCNNPFGGKGRSGLGGLR